MTRRELEHHAFQYLDALRGCDFDTQERLWAAAETDADLEARLTELEEAGLEAMQEEEAAALAAEVADAVTTHLPTATILADAPLTVAMVAGEIARSAAGPFGDRLKTDHRAAPAHDTLSSVLAWAKDNYADIPEAYWRQFRNAAMRLAASQNDSQYGLAARAAKHPKRRPS